MDNEWRSDLVKLLEYIISQAVYEKGVFLTELRSAWYEYLCQSGMKVEMDRPVDEGKYIRGYYTVLSDHTQKTTEIISEKRYYTNIPLIDIVERNITENTESPERSSTKEKFERYVRISPNRDDISRCEDGLKEITSLRLSYYANRLERLKGIEDMSLIFEEKMPDGYPDGELKVHLSRDMDYGSLPEYHDDHDGWCSSSIGTESLIEVVEKYQQQETVAVKIIIAPTLKGLRRGIELYWLEQMKYWIAVASHEEVENSSGAIGTHYRGPYKVEGYMAERLLEAYKVNPESVGEREVSRIAPSELKLMAINEEK